jgi:manganese/iron transport system ATP-binding protein
VMTHAEQEMTPRRPHELVEDRIVSGGDRTTAQLDLDCVTVSYSGGPALQEISLAVPHGAQVAVVGPNGAGKSTLFKALVGLLPLRAGSILIHGRAPNDQQDPVAYVPQREEVDWRFPVTVKDAVMMGRYGRLGLLRRPAPADRRAVASALETMGLTGLADRPIADLSGGQQQRVFLARALAQEPHVLLLDEPFTGVDAAVRENVLDVLETLRATNVTVLVSTHDLRLASERFELVALLNRRLIAYGPPADVFRPENVSAAFGGGAIFLDGMVVVDQCCGAHEHGSYGHDDREADVVPLTGVERGRRRGRGAP